MPAFLRLTPSLSTAREVGSEIIPSNATNPGVQITQNQAKEALYLTGTVTGANLLKLLSVVSAVDIIRIDQNAAVGANRAVITIYSNTALTSGGMLVSFYSDNAASSDPIIAIHNDGTGADIRLWPRATGGITDATEGSLAYDSTLHKLKIRGAAGWETVTSV